MKKLLLFIFAISQMSIYAQEILPIPADATSVWNIEYGSSDSECWYSYSSIYYINGTTVIDGNEYYLIYEDGEFKDYPTFPPNGGCDSDYLYNDRYRGGIRTEEGKVYGYTGYGLPELLLDFTLAVGETMYTSICIEGKTIESIEEIEIGGVMRKKFNFVTTNMEYCNFMIEGIGHERGLFESMDEPFENNSDLLCYGENEISIFGDNDCDFSIGVKDIESLNNFVSVYPNPTSNNIIINTSELTNQITLIRVFDIYGKMIQTFDPNSNYGDEIILNLENVPSGVYLIDLEVKNQVNIIKRISKN